MKKEEDNTTKYYENKHVFFQDDILYVLGEFNQDVSNNIIPRMQSYVDALSLLKDPKFEIVINIHIKGFVLFII